MYLLSAEDEYHAEEHRGEKQGFFRRYQPRFGHYFERLREGYRHALNAALESSTVFAACFFIFCLLSAGFIFLLGRDRFATVDAVQIRLHFTSRRGMLS